MLQLTGKQIDMVRRIITVQGKSRKPGGKNIRVAIPDELHRYLAAHGIDRRDHAVCYHGKPVKRIYTAWRSLLEECGLEYIRPHDLRHTFGTWLYEKTGDIRLVQESLHHTSVVTTMRYAHTRKDVQRAKINKALPELRQNAFVPFQRIARRGAETVVSSAGIEPATT